MSKTNDERCHPRADIQGDAIRRATHAPAERTPEPADDAGIPEETLDPADWQRMRALGHRMLDDALDYLESLPERPAWEHAPEHVKARFTGGPPADPQPAEDIYREYVDHVQPYQLGNSHPRFWGWVLGCGTAMGVYAEMLAAATNAVSGIYSFVSNNYVEMQVLDWCKQMLGFPATAGGLLTSGCSAANLIALAVARTTNAGFDVRRDGLSASARRLTVYCSEEAHSSLTKAVELLGMGRESLRRVPADDSLRLDMTALREMVAQDRRDGLLPICVVGVVGTTSTGAVDDLHGIADFCAAEGLWFHADGAFGAWAAIAPASRHLVSGMERADSLACDLHKWMYLTYPIGCVLVRDAEAQRRTFSLTPQYLAHGEGDRGLTAVDVPWLSDYGFELSRGFHALKAWMTLKEQGIAKYGRLIQQNIDQAHYLAGLIEASARLEPALPVSLNVVNFRYVEPGLADTALDDLNKQIEIELQEQGIAVPSIATIRGRKYVHVAITNHRSRREDFDVLVREVVRLGGELAQRQG